MGLPVRHPAERYTYGDYLTSPVDTRFKPATYGRAGVGECWLVHPTDRIVTVYGLSDGAYGRPDVFDLNGSTASRVLPELVIDWDRVLHDLD
jgi:hypothetical protein